MGNGNDWDIDPPSEQSSSDNANDPYRSSGGGEGGRGGGGRGGHGSGGAGPTGPSGGGSSGRGGGGEPMSPMEGWGGGPFDFGELISNAKTIFNRVKGPILLAYLGLFGINFLMQLTLSGLKISTHLVSGLGLATLIQIFSIICAFAVSAIASLQFAVCGPARERVFRGRTFEGAMDVIREAKERWLQVFLGVLVWGVGQVVGLLCCVIPLIPYFFFTNMVPYLLATREIEIQDAFKRSYVLSKKHWKTVGSFMLVGAIIIIPLFIFFAAIDVWLLVLDEVVREITSAVLNVIALTLSLPFLFLVFSAHMTIDAHETGESIR